MQRFIAILRGINVGGHRKIKMADLKQMLANMGFENVETYIQSGNIAFNSNESPVKLESNIEKEISKTFGFDVPVIIRNREEMANVINSNPYVDSSEITSLFVTFLSSQPGQTEIEKLNQFDVGDDMFIIRGKDIFMKCIGPYHKSKLTNALFEKNLKIKATSRNWKTCLKLHEMINK